MYADGHGPSGRHQDGAPLKNHLGERQTRGKDEQLGLLGPRGARYSRWFDTGRWWKGCPEQMAVWLETIPSSSVTVLGMVMMNREPVGKAAVRQRWKPHRYLQATRALYWSLNEPEHVLALLTSLRSIGAMQAGVEQRLPGHGLRPQDRGVMSTKRELSRSLMELQDAYGECVAGHETAEIYEQLPNRTVLYRIRRGKAGHGTGRVEFNEATELAIPPKAVKPLLAAVSGLLLSLRHRLMARPQDESPQQRGHYLPSRRRTWMARPHAMLELLPARLHWLAYEPEPGLFELPARRPGSRDHDRIPHRLRRGAKVVEDDWGCWPVAVTGYRRRYLGRAIQLRSGQLRWDPVWGDELRAWHDAQHATNLVQQRNLILVMNLALLYTMMPARGHVARDVHSTSTPARWLSDRDDADHWMMPARGHVARDLLHNVVPQRDTLYPLSRGPPVHITLYMPVSASRTGRTGHVCLMHEITTIDSPDAAPQPS